MNPCCEKCFKQGTKYKDGQFLVCMDMDCPCHKEEKIGKKFANAIDSLHLEGYAQEEKVCICGAKQGLIDTPYDCKPSCLSKQPQTPVRDRCEHCKKNMAVIFGFFDAIDEWPHWVCEECRDKLREKEIKEGITTPSTPESWEERLDFLLRDILLDEDCDVSVDFDAPKKIKDFIATELLRAKEEREKLFDKGLLLGHRCSATDINLREEDSNAELKVAVKKREEEIRLAERSRIREEIEKMNINFDKKEEMDILEKKLRRGFGCCGEEVIGWNQAITELLTLLK